jgi:hypothetical protein
MATPARFVIRPDGRRRVPQMCRAGRVRINGGGIQMQWEKIKLGLLSAIGGAIVLAIIGFGWGGWVTGGAAQNMAGEMAADALVDRLAPMCVAQFHQDPEKDQKRKALQETSVWQREDYVEKQGWATMPGEKEPDSKVASECANRIMQSSQ